MGCGREKLLAARVGTFRKRGIVQSATLAAVLPGGKERNWTPIQIIIIIIYIRHTLQIKIHKHTHTFLHKDYDKTIRTFKFL